MGNLRIPPAQQGNPNDIRNAMDQLRQQAIVNNAAQNAIPQQQNQALIHALAQSRAGTMPTGPLPGAVALHPADIQSDILRIQQNIIESLRQLNAQHDQLEVVHSLLGELNRIQQSSGIAGATGQELPPIAPLNPQDSNTFTPQAFFARGPALRQGDDGVPAGLALPEGWTLRPMALAPRSVQESRIVSAPVQPSHSEEDTGPSSSSAPTGSGPSVSDPRTSSSPKPAEPSSLESSWSFGNVAERTEAEASSSAVAASSSGDQNLTRRTVTVEDVEENEQ
jgi:E3 ubiquitin-protein ligase synoviolin